MKEENNLYHLIHDLSNNEKRFFYSYTSVFSHSTKIKNYIKLFDTYLSVKKFNREVLNQKITAVVSSGNVNAANKYLKERILESLKVFNKNQSKQSQDLEEISIIQMLKERGNYKSVFKRSKRLVRKKLKNDNLEHIDILYNFLHDCRLPLFTNDSNGFEYSKTIRKDQLKAIEHRRTTLKIDLIFEELRCLHYSGEDKNLESQTAKLLKELEETAEDTELSINQKYKYLNVKYMLLCDLGVFEETHKLIEELYVFVSANGSYFSYNNKCQVYVNFLKCLLEKNEKEKFFEVLNELKSTLQQPGIHQRNYTYWYYLRYLDYSASNFVELPTNVHNEIKQCCDNKDLIPSETQQVSLSLRLASYHFIIFNYEQSLELFDEIYLQKIVKPHNYEFLSSSIIYSILLHLTNNESLAKSRYQLFRRKLKREGLLKSPLDKIFDIVSTFIHSELNHGSVLACSQSIFALTKEISSSPVIEDKLYSLLCWTNHIQNKST